MMTFEKHIRSVSRAASQSLGILRKSWRVFYDRLLLVRCFRCFVLPFLEHCSAVWCPQFNWGCVECDSAHRRSEAVFWMLDSIRCNPMHPLYGAQPLPYVADDVLSLYPECGNYTLGVATMRPLYPEWPHRQGGCLAC